MRTVLFFDVSVIFGYSIPQVCLIICLQQGEELLTEQNFEALSGASRMHMYNKLGAAVCMRVVKPIDIDELLRMVQDYAKSVY